MSHVKLVADAVRMVEEAVQTPLIVLSTCKDGSARADGWESCADGGRSGAVTCMLTSTKTSERFCGIITDS